MSRFQDYLDAAATGQSTETLVEGSPSFKDAVAAVVSSFDPVMKAIDKVIHAANLDKNGPGRKNATHLEELVQQAKEYAGTLR